MKLTNQEIQNTREYQDILNDMLDSGMDMNYATRLALDLVRNACEKV